MTIHKVSNKSGKILRAGLSSGKQIITLSFPQPGIYVDATGGDETGEYSSGGLVYRYHKFTTVGSHQLTVSQGGEVEYVVVGGGGGGGGSPSLTSAPGGGGAGGYRSSVQGELSGTNLPPESPLILAPGTYYATVGAGGGLAANGQPSSFMSIQSAGGGSGNAGNGGSGGGGRGPSSGQQAGGSGVIGQGFAGGIGATDSITYRAGGGGGGASQTGGDAMPGSDRRFRGGNGLVTNITGTPLELAGGGSISEPRTIGGGGAGNASLINALSNTGGGGAGGFNNASWTGGSGGSGIVIVRYVIGVV